MRSVWHNACCIGNTWWVLSSSPLPSALKVSSERHIHEWRLPGVLFSRFQGVMIHGASRVKRLTALRAQSYALLIRVRLRGALLHTSAKASASAL